MDAHTPHNSFSVAEIAGISAPSTMDSFWLNPFYRLQNFLKSIPDVIFKRVPSYGPVYIYFKQFLALSC